MEYLLTCECGAEHRVSKSQADKQIECQCGKTLRIPTLRGLAELPVAPEEDVREAIGAANPWKGARGIIFAVCVALSLFAVYRAGMYLLAWSYFSSTYTTEDFIAEGESQLDSYGPDELAQAWNEFEAFEIREKSRPAFLIERQFAKEQLIKSGIAGVVVLVLAGVCIGLWTTVPRNRT